MFPDFSSEESSRFLAVPNMFLLSFVLSRTHHLFTMQECEVDRCKNKASLSSTYIHDTHNHTEAHLLDDELVEDLADDCLHLDVAAVAHASALPVRPAERCLHQLAHYAAL